MVDALSKKVTLPQMTIILDLERDIDQGGH